MVFPVISTARQLALLFLGCLEPWRHSSQLIVHRVVGDLKRQVLYPAEVVLRSGTTIEHRHSFDTIHGHGIAAEVAHDTQQEIEETKRTHMLRYGVMPIVSNGALT